MAEETKIPSELIISQKWDKLLERVAINARARRRAPPPHHPSPSPHWACRVEVDLRPFAARRCARGGAAATAPRR